MVQILPEIQALRVLFPDMDSGSLASCLHRLCLYVYIYTYIYIYICLQACAAKAQLGSRIIIYVYLVR